MSTTITAYDHVGFADRSAISETILPTDDLTRTPMQRPEAQPSWCTGDAPRIAKAPLQGIAPWDAWLRQSQSLRHVKGSRATEQKQLLTEMIKK